MESNENPLPAVDMKSSIRSGTDFLDAQEQVTCYTGKESNPGGNLPQLGEDG
jgi:hypothetical protein